MLSGKQTEKAENAPPAQETVSKADYEALAEFRGGLRRFLRFSEDAARAEGLTPQQHQLLLAVKGQQGREWATISELAHSLQVRHNAVVGLVDRCAAAGLAQRATGAEDRRQVQVTLTAGGEDVLRRLSARHIQELRVLRQTLRLSFWEEQDKTGG